MLYRISHINPWAASEDPQEDTDDRDISISVWDSGLTRYLMDDMGNTEILSCVKTYIGNFSGAWF